MIKTSVAIVFGTNQIRTIKEMGKKDGLKQTKIELNIGGDTRFGSIGEDPDQALPPTGLDRVVGALLSIDLHISEGGGS